MILHELSLRNFRNHTMSDILFEPGINVFYGKNGQGKTNVLDAIHFLSLTKSFQVSQDLPCIKTSESAFRLQGKFFSDDQLDYHVHVDVNRVDGKHFTVNGQSDYSQLDLIGQFPTVLLSLEDRSITMGSPGDRRRFLDTILFQVSRSYIDHSKRLKRIVKQRNDLLSTPGSITPTNLELIHVWTEELINSSIPIIQKRLNFLNTFRSILKDMYLNELSGFEQPELDYVFCDEVITDPETFSASFIKKSKSLFSLELEKRQTLIGPHRDDLRISLNGKETKYFASQGQHKLLLVALKIAMWKFLNQELDEKPILLIDDIFSELDQDRMETIGKFLNHLGQVFITLTDREATQYLMKAAYFEVHEGKIWQKEKVQTE